MKTAAPLLPELLTNPDRPEPESAGAKFRIRLVAVAALAMSLGYLIWRTVATLNMDAWWVSIPLLVLEIHAAAGLALFTFSLWDVDSVPPAPPCTRAPGRVAVFIPTYNEPIDILLPTVAAAVALQPAHETWVLDDGDRPEVRRLARELGAQYLARTERTGAKAGNVNNALAQVEADFVAVLDADHVAGASFLTNTLGYFADPKIAFVQTPQDFYNTDSFEHEKRRMPWSRNDRAAAYSEQALFYRVLQPGKNRWQAAFWCGTGAVARVSALREVGGVATETVTEDIHTTIRLHKLGWHSVYHNEVLSRGLAAADASQYQLQRVRWGTGAMQLLASKDNPFITPGLRPTQRLAYATTLLGWFDSWRSLGYLLLPPAVLLSGAVPIQANALTFTGMFAATFLLQRAALVRLARGRAPHLLSTVFEFVRMSANLSATLTLFTRRGSSFQVTPKGRLDGDRRRQSAPRLLVGLGALSLASAIWFALTVAGWTPLRYGVPWAAYGSAIWLGVNGVLLIMATGRIRDERFAGERRASVRFDVHADGEIDGVACTVADLSLTGARVTLAPGVLATGEAGTDRALVIRLAREHELQVRVRSTRLGADGGLVLGLQFAPDQAAARADLAVALFQSEIVPDRVPSDGASAPAPAGVAVPDPVAMDASL